MFLTSKAKLKGDIPFKLYVLRFLQTFRTVFFKILSPKCLGLEDTFDFKLLLLEVHFVFTPVSLVWGTALKTYGNAL